MTTRKNRDTGVSEDEKMVAFDDIDVSRRGAAVGLFSAFGLVALSSCVDDDSSEPSENTVTSDLTDTTICWVDTMANLKTVTHPAVGVTDSKVAILEGYFAAHDGGGGVFCWDHAATTENNGTLIRPNDVSSGSAGRWRRLYSGRINVKWFGARGDGTTDDRAPIQEAIQAAASGGCGIFVPNATYRTGQSGSNSWCLSIPAGMTITGESRSGVILKQTPGIATSVRLLLASGADVAVQNLTLDGDKANQSVNEHRHGILADGTTRLVLRDVTCQNFTGDGIYLYTAANDSYIENVLCTGNARNGLTIGGASLDGLTVIGGQFKGNAVQQFDCEPSGAVNNVVITDALLDAGGVSNDYVLALGGVSATVRARGWRIQGCTINGPVYCIYTDDIAFIGNRGINASTSYPHLYVFRKCIGVQIIGNSWRSTANTANDRIVVHISGGTAGDRASRVVIADNDIRNDVTGGIGIYVGETESIDISNNTIEGPGTTAAGYGVFVRTTVVGHPIHAAKVIGNHIKNWGTAAVAFAGSSGVAAQVNACDVSHNTFDSDVASVQLIGVSFNNDSADAVQQATWIGNSCTGNTTTELSTYPAGGVVLIGGNHGAAGAVYSCAASPESVITAPIGCLAMSRAGGASTTLYIKTSGTGNTGWTAK